MKEKSRLYLDKYLSSLLTGVAQKHTSFSASYFCADEYNANICADLILSGEKRASCSLEYWYSHKCETMPRVGHLQVVTDWSGEPICIIELTSISKCKYSQVTAEFAIEEGEGDKSLKSWREDHWIFFSLECKKLGIEQNEDMLLVLEQFRVVYK